MANHWLLSRLKRELHWTKFLFRSKDWRTVAFTPWLPYNWFQVIFILTRWIFATYYLFWLIYMFATSSQPRLLPLALTVWGLFLWTLYLIVAALASTTKFVFVAFDWCKQRPNARVNEGQHGNGLDGRDYEVVTWSSDQVAWYQKIHWILFYLGSEVQLTILILYWGVLYRLEAPESVYSAVNFNIHLTGGVVALLDLLIGGITVSLYHMYASVALGCVYSVFTAVYYAAGGTDAAGNNYIYSIVDYGTSPGIAAAVVLATTLVLIPLVHLFLYLLACVRRWIVYRLRSCFAKKTVPNRKEPSSQSPGAKGGETSATVSRGPLYSETRFSEEN